MPLEAVEQNQVNQSTKEMKTSTGLRRKDKLIWQGTALETTWGQILLSKQTFSEHLHHLPPSPDQGHRTVPIAECWCFCHNHCFQQKPVSALDPQTPKDHSELGYLVEKDM